MSNTRSCRRLSIYRGRAAGTSIGDSFSHRGACSYLHEELFGGKNTINNREYHLPFRNRVRHKVLDVHLARSSAQPDLGTRQKFFVFVPNAHAAEHTDLL